MNKLETDTDYLDQGYNTGFSYVFGLQFVAEKQFKGNLDDALKFALQNLDKIEGQEHIPHYEEAHRYLKDQATLRE